MYLIYNINDKYYSTVTRLMCILRAKETLKNKDRYRIT